MRNKIAFLIILLIPFFGLLLFGSSKQEEQKINVNPEIAHWLLLHRKSGKEFLYYGAPGDAKNSKLVREFQVKTGTPGYSPTPLPKLMGKDYWVIVNKESSSENPETAPYFLQLNIPTSDDWPYGPVPYNECGGQCNWVLPGYFGLHGVNGNNFKLSIKDPGSSGCIRHSDSDITYLFDILDLDREEIRYYIEDI
jgi:lipoprotein-anchoring transpeptidase ErfK/SrfK